MYLLAKTNSNEDLLVDYQQGRVSILLCHQKDNISPPKHHSTGHQRTKGRKAKDTMAKNGQMELKSLGHTWGTLKGCC